MQKFKIICWATAPLMCILCSGLNLGWRFRLSHTVPISKERFHLCQLPTLIACPDFFVHWTAGTKTFIQVFVYQLHPLWWKEHLKEEPWAWTFLTVVMSSQSVGLRPPSELHCALTMAVGRIIWVFFLPLKQLFDSPPSPLKFHDNYFLSLRK